MYAHPRATGVAHLRIDQIGPGEGGPPRAHLDARRLRALAAQVKRRGLREPIIVAPSSDSSSTACGCYQIVEGELRWRAAQLAGLQDVPCIIDPRRGEERRRLLAAAAAALRRDELGVLDHAAVLVELMDVIGFDATEAGALLGLSYQQARRMVRLHRAPEPVRAALGARRIDPRAALELVRIHNRMTRRSERDDQRTGEELESLVARVARERWSIRQLEDYARALACPAGDEAPRAASPGFRIVRGRLVVNTACVARGELGPRERALLVTILEDLLRALKAT